MKLCPNDFLRQHIIALQEKLDLSRRTNDKTFLIDEHYLAQISLKDPIVGIFFEAVCINSVCLSLPIKGVYLILDHVIKALYREILLVALHLPAYWLAGNTLLADDLPPDEVPNKVEMSLGVSVEKVDKQTTVTQETACDEWVWEIVQRH